MGSMAPRCQVMVVGRPMSGGTRTSGMRPSALLTGMEEHADRSLAKATVIIVSPTLLC